MLLVVKSVSFAIIVLSLKKEFSDKLQKSHNYGCLPNYAIFGNIQILGSCIEDRMVGFRRSLLKNGLT